MIFSANHMIKRCHTVSVLYRPNLWLPSNTAPNFYSPHVVTRYYSITTTETKLLCANLIQFFLCARFKPRVTQRNKQPARREHVENVFNAYNSIKNSPYHLLYPIFSILNVIILREKLTLSCNGLGTTYRIRTKHFVRNNCVESHRPQTTNNSSTFNSRIRLTCTNHTLLIKT
jgi:hypothetical protein